MSSDSKNCFYNYPAAGVFPSRLKAERITMKAAIASLEALKAVFMGGALAMAEPA